MGEDVGVGLLAGSNTTSGVPIEHLDYRYVGECKNSKELEKILNVLRWVMVDFNIWILFSFLQVLCKDLIFIKFSLPHMAEVEVACIQRHHLEIMHFILNACFSWKMQDWGPISFMNATTYICMVKLLRDVSLKIWVITKVIYLVLKKCLIKKEFCRFDLKNVSNIKKNKFPRVQWKKFKCRRDVDIDASAKRTARLQTLA